MRIDCALIDDDPIIRLSWEIIAGKHKKCLRTFESPEAFFSQSSEIDLSTPVYVDYHLGGGMNGVDVARRLIAHGFVDVQLATGDLDLPIHSEGIRVVGKNPPWLDVY